MTCPWRITELGGGFNRWTQHEFSFFSHRSYLFCYSPSHAHNHIVRRFARGRLSVPCPGPQTVGGTTAAQNALFDDYYENELRNFPERATAFGDYRYNDQLADYSLAAIAKRDKSNRDYLARIQAISSAEFSDQDQLSHDLLIRVLQQRVADYDLKEYEMPINQQNGAHTALADLPLSVPLDSVKALRGLHRAPPSNSSRAFANDRSLACRHERQLDAREVPHRENSRSMPGHH